MEIRDISRWKLIVFSITGVIILVIEKITSLFKRKILNPEYMNENQRQTYLLGQLIADKKKDF